MNLSKGVTVIGFYRPRATIIFARRIERIRDSGNVDLFIELARNLLAHRPQNYELWMELGRLYEQLNKSDEAWICYDHVQTLKPHSLARDEFLQRLMKMDGDAVKPWTRPPISKRQEFLDQMVTLASRVSTSDITKDGIVAEVNESITAKDKLDDLLQAGDFSEAFFVARRLVAEGEDWAEECKRQEEGLIDMLPKFVLAWITSTMESSLTIKSGGHVVFVKHPKEDGRSPEVI